MKVRSVFLVLLFLSAVVQAKTDPRLKGSFRADKAGWIFVHLQGSPNDIGFQDGYLLAPEIDNALKALKYYLRIGTKRDWSWYRKEAAGMFWPKLTREYKEEIEGIAEGLRARGRKYDRIDITALNGWMELAQYYLPALRAGMIHRAGDDRSPGHCSAFIANGSYTADGKIVMAHNTWVNYVVGERWNIIEDIVPDKGYRIMMDAFPGFIDSGDDFAENSAGILITETTIAQYRGFDPNGTPEFMRAREAEQYANSIDDFVRIMTHDNNGAYANDWLIGDTKTNEIARLELGLTHYRVWKTKDGYYVGANFPSDPQVVRDETHFKVHDPYSSMNARKKRWEELMKEYKGKIDVKLAESFLADHYDVVRKRDFPGSRSLCGHNDEDPLGIPQWGWAPYFPGGSVQGKVTTTHLADKMEFWAHMGHPCGENFIASKFFAAHPRYRWMSPYLHNMMSHPWTLFSAKDTVLSEPDHSGAVGKVRSERH